MKKSKFFICLFIIFPFVLQAQKAKISEEEKMFNQARQLLSMRQINEALPSLETLYNINPENANYNFLLGAAYRELGDKKPSAIFHLEKAVKNVSVKYDASTYLESNAPMLSYYYLATALVDENRCDEAAAAMKKLQNFGNKIDPYFIREIKRNLEKCPYNSEIDSLVVDEEITADTDSFQIKVEDILAFQKTEKDNLDNIVTQTISYTTNSPLWGVQIGTYSDVIPLNRFKNIKNVDAFMDSTGMIRYVVGHFSYKKQAESLLDFLSKEEGYQDAFVVNVNDKNKFIESVVSINNINIRRGIVGKVTFKVQIGAFTDEVPPEMAAQYLTVDNIQEYNYEDYTLMLVGNEEHYSEAEILKNKLLKEGIEGSFIVAFNNGRKIPIAEAREFKEGKH